MQTDGRSGARNLGKKERYAFLPTEMQNSIQEYGLGLHVRDSTRENYLGRLQWFAGYLVKQGIQRFQDASKKDIDLFLSGYKNLNTRNLFVHILRTLYKDLKPEVVKRALTMIVVNICDITGFGRTPFNSKPKGRCEGEGGREQNDSGEGEEPRRASSRYFHEIVLKAL